MAHQALASAWLYKNKETFQVRFNEMSWPKKYDIPFFDLEVTAEFNNQKMVGRGVDANRSLALEKASSELIENTVCLINHVDSVGVSISSYINYEAHAKSEALERYYLDQHLQKKISFKLESFDSGFLVDDIINKLNLDVVFYRFNTESENFGYICKVANKKSSKIASYGFALSHEKIKSIEKSFIEALPNYLFIFENSNRVDKLPWQLTTDFRTKIEPLLQNDFNSDLIFAPIIAKNELNVPDFIKESDFPYQIIKFKIEKED